MPWSALLHAGSFGFGDVLIVGLVLQLPAEVLDGFIQAFFQRHLPTQKHALKDKGTGAAAIVTLAADGRRKVNTYEAGIGGIHRGP